MAATQAITPIAIVGMACRYPGEAVSPSKFWDMLKSGRDAHTPETQRYRADAFLHPNRDRRGTIQTRGGYFLAQDPYAFDAAFFNLTYQEALALDPLVRQALEVTYECLEGAGLPLAEFRGTRTAVYMGSGMSDYHDALVKDPEHVPTYSALGAATEMLANRLSHFYDLRGPSVAVQTACSSSLVAVHQACQSIRCGEVDMALAGGSSLVLTPEVSTYLGNLSFLSPGGHCRSFDEAGDGFARGEGCGVVLLKRLDLAVRDGDTIRAIIRGSGVNSDGFTPGISFPSSEAQADLIRSVYQSAWLSLSSTQYVEAHGTGTKAGDPIEVRAIFETIGTARQAVHDNTPLFVGSVKPNIGHLEAASAIAGLMKGVLALENKMIPPNIRLQRLNTSIPFQRWNIHVPTSLTPWPEAPIRQMSVSSFGAGGTNAHCVLTEASETAIRDALSDGGRHTTNGIGAYLHFRHDNESFGGLLTKTIPPSSNSPRVFILSCHDQAGIERAARSLADHLDSNVKDVAASPFLANLAYTLGQRRSRLPWKAALVASDARELRSALTKLGSSSAVRADAGSSSGTPRIGFVFTGQGAQWARMGIEMMARFPTFHQSAQQCAEYLRSHCDCPWDAIEELSKSKSDESPLEAGHPEYTQTLCTLLQIALVDELRAWGVVPSTVVGHSSGEIAAAYCAGALSKKDAMAVAFFRGRSSAELWSHQGMENGGGGFLPEAPEGAMMAVGLSPQEAQQWIERAGLDHGAVAIACVNSPSSVTLSGDKDAIQHLIASFEKHSVFARLLRTGVAYHSAHMDLVMGSYSMAISHIKPPDDCHGRRNFRALGPPIMHSSVTGSAIHGDELGPYYWVRNLVSPVLFSQALTSLVRCVKGSSSISASARQNVDILVEIGPHSTLAGPIKEVLNSLDMPGIRYFPTLMRNTNAVRTTLTLAGQLLCLGVPVDLSLVNEGGPTQTSSRKHLVDLPPYPWNHSRSFRHQGRSHTDWLTREHPRQGLLGTRVAPSHEATHTWRNMIRLSEEPWLREHKVMGLVLVPASALVCMAIEATRQTRDPGREVHSYRLRDMQVLAAVLIDENDAVESLVSLRPHGLGSAGSGSGSNTAWSWYEFTVSTSKSADQPVRDNCKGLIHIRYKDVVGTGHGDAGIECEVKERERAHVTEYRGIVANSPHRKTRDDFYRYTEMASWEFGPNYRLISEVQANRGQGVFRVEIPNWKESPAMDTFSRGQMERPFVIHPVLLDTAFQSWGVGVWGEDPTFDLRRPLVPTVIGELDVSADFPCPYSLPDAGRGDEAGLNIRAYSKTKKHGFKDVSFDVCFLDPGMSTVYLSCRDFRSTQLADAMDDSLSMSNGNAPSAIGDQYWTEICDRISWSVDVNWMDASELNRHLSTIPLDQTFQELLRLVLHAEPGQTVVEILPSKDVIPDSITRSVGIGLAAKVLYGIVEPRKKEGKNEQPHIHLLDDAGNASSVAVEGCADLVVLSDRAGLWFCQEQRTHCSEQQQQPSLMTALKNIMRQSGRMLTFEPTFPNEVRSDLEQSGLQILRDLAGLAKQEDAATVTGRVVLVSRGSSTSRGLMASSGFRSDGRTQQADQTEEVAILSRALGSDHDQTAIDRAFLTSVSTALRDEGISGSLLPLDETTIQRLDNKVCICLFDLGSKTPILQDMDSKNFDLIRQILLRAKSVLWVSWGEEPGKHLADGLLRVLRYELGLKCLQILRLDGLDKNNAATAATAAARIIALSSAHSTDETEFRLDQHGHIMTSRYYKDGEMNASLKQYLNERTVMMPLKDHGGPLKLTIKKPGLLDTLVFEPAHSDDTVEVDSANSLEPGMVQIEVHASGLNFRDVMASMGLIPDSTLGGEASGVVTATGSGVSRIRVGDRVSALCHQAHATTVTAHEACCLVIPERSRLTSMAQHAAMPVVHATAYYALVKLARLRRGQSILVHAAAGGVGQAALQLARHIGLVVYATAGSDEKRAFLHTKYGVERAHIFSSRHPGFADGVLRMTGGRGVDCVLNTLSGELLRQSWACLAPFGTFVEIGLRDILENTPLEMRHFAKTASFSFFDLGTIMREAPETIRDILQNVSNLTEQGVLAPPSPLKAYPVAEVEEAFRTMQSGKHRGKLVLSFKDARGNVSLRPTDSLRLDRKATYLFVGGMGGLGRSLAAMFADAGARNLVFISRSGLSGASSEAAKALCDKLSTAGVRVGVYEADAADKQALEAALRQCAADGFPPIRGVIQMAMVLRDVPFEKMTHEQWVQSTRPKVQGSWNLHMLFEGPADLDFFIMLASVAGIIGNEAQANYAAGNTFQDAVAHYRRARGLKGTAIDLGIMKDVGVVAEKGAVGKMLTTYEGVLGIHEPVFHALIRSVISAERSAGRGRAPAQICTGLPTAARLHAHGVEKPEYLEHEPRFAPLNLVTEVAGQAHQPNGAAPVVASIETALAGATSQGDAAACVADALAAKIADIVQIPASEIDVGRAMYTYGVDSLVALEIRNWIVRTIKANVSLLEVTAATPMREFAWSVAGRSSLAKFASVSGNGTS